MSQGTQTEENWSRCFKFTEQPQRPRLNTALGNGALQNIYPDCSSRHTLWEQFVATCSYPGCQTRRDFTIKKKKKKVSEATKRTVNSLLLMALVYIVHQFILFILFQFILNMYITVFNPPLLLWLILLGRGKFSK